MMDGYWDVVDEQGARAQSVPRGVPAAGGGRRRRTRRRRPTTRKHVEYFYHKCLHVPPQWFAPPGNQDYRSLLAANRNPVRRAEDPKTLRYKDFVDKGYVIAGSPATVRERLVEEVIKGLHVGNLMVLVQIGSMPHELTLKNIDLFAPRGAARPARHLGRRGLGEPLVARAACAERASRSPWARGVGAAHGLADVQQQAVDGLAGPGAHAGPRQGRTARPSCSSTARGA